MVNEKLVKKLNAKFALIMTMIRLTNSGLIISYDYDEKQKVNLCSAVVPIASICTFLKY